MKMFKINSNPPSSDEIKELAEKEENMFIEEKHKVKLLKEKDNDLNKNIIDRFKKSYTKSKPFLEVSNILDKIEKISVLNGNPFIIMNFSEKGGSESNLKIISSSSHSISIKINGKTDKILIIESLKYSGLKISPIISLNDSEKQKRLITDISDVWDIIIYGWDEDYQPTDFGKEFDLFKNKKETNKIKI